jgi:uncharacterized protein (TIGR02284 family)
MARDVIQVLNDLIKLDRDAIRAYDQALSACETSLIKDNLSRFKGDHERHVTELSVQVKALGGEPATSSGVMGALIEGFTAITSHGDHSALLAMKGNEQLTNRKYSSALEEELTSEARNVVERGHQDEKRHLAWIEDALSRRIWEKAA